MPKTHWAYFAMSQAAGNLLVYLKHLQNNWSLLNKDAGTSECGAVIKADAYGLGIEAVSKALYAAGCRTFFVANVQEALTAKRCLGGGEDARIFVLQGFADDQEMQVCIAQNLVPVLIRRSMVDHWMASEVAKKAPCAIKVNTGMNRLGLDFSCFQDLLSTSVFRSLNVRLIMSHLACADDASNALNTKQLARFKEVKALSAPLFSSACFSLANSAGIYLSPDYHFDLVRPGYALYGGQPFVDRPSLKLDRVLELRLPVLQVRRVPVGASVGYGQGFVAKRETLVATVASGYADGVIRLLGDRAHGWFGEKIPMIGRVSMDSCAFDVTDLDQPPREGDEIELIGSHVSIESLSALVGTIGYEVLTSLGARLQRQYIS